MSFSKGGSRQTQKGASGVDQQTNDYLQKVWGAAQGAGQAGPSPLLGGASDFYTKMMGGGNLGLGALSGDPTATQTLMNPYQSQVIDANNAQWQKVNQQTQNQVNDRATQAGAFGGSRQGVATGTALAANNLAQQQQTAGLLSSGYGDAMSRAGQLAGMGFNAAGANANLGFGGVGSPQQWMLQMLKSGFIMPTGQQSSASGSNVYGGVQLNPLKMFQGGGGG